MRAPIGLRISTRRPLAFPGRARAPGRHLGELSQSDRTQQAPVGGLPLRRLAEQLKVDVAELSGGGAPADRGGRRSFRRPGAALGGHSDGRCARAGPEPGGGDRDRAPASRLSGRHSNVDDHADRLRSDPLLAQLLHQVLSGITAVRSGAEILEDVRISMRTSASIS